MKDKQPLGGKDWRNADLNLPVTDEHPSLKAPYEYPDGRILTGRQTILFARLYDPLMSFRYAKARTNEQQKELIFDIIELIDEATKDGRS